MKASKHDMFKEAVGHFFREFNLALHHILIIIQNTISQQNFMLV